MNSFFRFLVGFFSGALLGAALAVLFAPASGEELRQQICMRTQSFQDEINKAAEQRRAELKAQLNTLRSTHI